jgi:hypothetical protein
MDGKSIGMQIEGSNAKALSARQHRILVHN